MNAPDFAAIAAHNKENPMGSADVRLCFFSGSDRDGWCASVWILKPLRVRSEFVKVSEGWDVDPVRAQAKAIEAWKCGCPNGFDDAAFCDDCGEWHDDDPTGND